MPEPDAENAAGLLLCDDFFFTSKITGTAAALGVPIIEADSLPAALDQLEAGGIRFVIVDLSYSGLNVAELVAALHASDRPHVLGFDSHVNEERIQAARDAGFDEVLPRSRFSAKLADILRQLASE